MMPLSRPRRSDRVGSRARRPNRCLRGPNPQPSAPSSATGSALRTRKVCIAHSSTSRGFEFGDICAAPAAPIGRASFFFIFGRRLRRGLPQPFR
eukprot:gene14600-biopygen18646